MGVFVYVYHSSLIREHHVTVGSVLQTIVSGLSTEEQLELLRDMKRYLEGQGISVAEVFDVEGAFESRCEEATEGSYEGREAGHEE